MTDEKQKTTIPHSYNKKDNKTIDASIYRIPRKVVKAIAVEEKSPIEEKSKISPTKEELDALEKSMKKGDKSAFDTLLKYANQNNADAQCLVGICYGEGYVVQKNYNEALKWFYKANEQNNARAQNAIGVCYYNGYGVKQDYTEAVKWYQKAANRCNTTAQSWVGYCYEFGYGVNKDINEAIKWYKIAAKKGNDYAAKRLKELNK